MAAFRERDKQHFPLRSVESVADFFRDHLQNNDEPNLALLSIILGCIENSLTVNRSSVADLESDSWKPIFPAIELRTVEALYQRFVTHIKSNVDLSHFSNRHASRELIKKVSDVIWNSLCRSYYKDKAHLQTLYAFLTGSKLDCFGLALGVVAGCQILGFSDVNLALSEDHAWVVYGADQSNTAEVTWHGKGNEDKRGQPIGQGVSQQSWLYLNGHPVVCSHATEVAAMVSAINPAINATTDSIELGTLQQDLLWMLYDLGHLDKYPMGLGNLGDCEEISPTQGRPSSVGLFQKSIDAAKKYYSNMHVYPYTYLGGYFFRKQRYGDALYSWAQAASVIAKYNYSREDEEIYKEFLEIANENIPHIVKVCSEGVSLQSGRALLLDPDVYALLLQFYDGICQWEEGSNTPVLHITWAKHLVFSLSKFDGYAREHCLVEAEGEVDSESEEDEVSHNNNVNKLRLSESNTHQYEEANSEEQIKTTIEELVSKVGEEAADVHSPNLAALAQACGESILNPQYLLSGGEPFTTSAPILSTTVTDSNGTNTDVKVDYPEFYNSKSRDSPILGLSMDSVLKADSPSEVLACRSIIPTVESSSNIVSSQSNGSVSKLVLHSAKLKALKKLLVAEKLNASAIKLQVTAQSQVHLKHSKITSDYDYSLPRKRTRRD